MTKEKNIDTSKQADKFADERLNDDELDNVAGGTGEENTQKLDVKLILESNKLLNSYVSHGCRTLLSYVSHK